MPRQTRKNATSRHSRQRLPALPPRPRDAHKGDFGRVLIIGGSAGMSGAPALAAMGALRAGAGLVTMAVPRNIQSIVAALCPCATSIGLPETTDGRIEPAEALKVLRGRGLAGTGAESPPDVLVVGMGVGSQAGSTGDLFWDMIDAFRMEACVPVVADADALNLLCRTADESPGQWVRQSHPRTIMTPHPGELARLLSMTTAEIQADRPAAVKRVLERKTIDTSPAPGPVLVLKGSGTIVSDSRRMYVNRTGNPGMATGGTGDVLAGIIGALVGQKLDLYDAAVLGVHLHGLAGDLAAAARGEVALIATDLLEFLPQAWFRLRSHRGRSNHNIRPVK